MRWAIAAALGFTLSYFEVGVNVLFGSIVTLMAAFLSTDIQEGVQLTKALREHGELQADENERDLKALQAGVEALRLELHVVAKAVNAMNRRFEEAAAPVKSIGRPKGPWEP